MIHLANPDDLPKLNLQEALMKNFPDLDVISHNMCREQTEKELMVMMNGPVLQLLIRPPIASSSPATSSCRSSSRTFS